MEQNIKLMEAKGKNIIIPEILMNTGNENKITVKIVCIGQNISTKTLGSMQTAKWNDNAAKICSRYNLEIKNNVTSSCKSTHSGIWTHN